MTAVYIDGQGDLWEDTGLLHAPGDPILQLTDGSGVTYPRSDVDRIWGGITPITPGGDDRAVPRQPQLRAGA